MTSHQIRQYMKRNGFEELKQTLHCTVWRDALGNQVATATRPSGDRRAWLNIQGDVRKALKKREAMEKTMMYQHTPVDREPARRVVQPELKVSMGEMFLNKLTGTVNPAPVPRDKYDNVPSKTPTSKRGRSRGPRPRYTVAAKDAIGIRVLEMHAEGVSQIEQAKVLNKEGFTTPSGRPLKSNTVAYFYQILGLANRNHPQKKFKRKILGIASNRPEKQPSPERVASDSKQGYPGAVVAAQTTAPLERQLSDYMIQILKDPLLPAEKKVKMLLMYVEG